MKFESDTALHHKFLENMHDAVLILDQNYNVTDSNHVATVWYGYTPEEFKKLNLSDIRAPEERDKITEQMQTVVSKEGGVWETVHMRKDGTTFPVEVSSTPIIVGEQSRFYHVVRDISERKKNEHTLRASEERYKLIVEFSPDTIFMHRDGSIIYMNAAGLKLFGADSPEQIVGKSLWSLYPPERHGIVRARNQSMEQTRQAVPTIEHPMLRIDGSIVNVEATARLIELEDGSAFYVILRDITERKKTQMYLDMQYAVSRYLVDSANMMEATRTVLDLVCRNLKLDSGKIWGVDKKDHLLRFVSTWSNGKFVDKATEKMNSKVVYKPGEGLPGKVCMTNESYWIEDLHNESYYPEGLPYKMALAVPIMNGQELVGVMEFLSANSMARDSVVLQALKGIGDQLGAFLIHKRFEKDLAYLSKHDPITGLANRTFFEETLAFELKVAKNQDQMLAVIFIDIDSFSSINEALGHAAGDQLLKSIGSRLENLDLPNENIGRFGPQFALILNGVQSVDEVNSFLAKVNLAIAEAFMVHNQNINIKFNYGIAMYPNDGAEVGDLMRNASVALSTAKETGGGSVQFCNEELHNRASNRIRIENELRNALDNQEFVLFYQPIVHLPTMQVQGFESLIRWNKNGKIINPYEFIAVAERTHLIIPIGEWIMRTACTQCHAWQQNLDHPLFVSVNISGIQFKHSGILDLLKNVLQDTGLDPGSLKIELTESIAMENTQQSIDLLRKIKELGVKISIDDFGTGYSSLNYLRHLPIDFLKIDQSFVRSMTTNANDAAIVKTIIELATNLGYKVIAEGVETKAQLNVLQGLGCDYIQGYYFSPPLPVADAAMFLQQGKLIS